MGKLKGPKSGYLTKQRVITADVAGIGEAYAFNSDSIECDYTFHE